LSKVKQRSWFYYLRSGSPPFVPFSGGRHELAAALLEELHGLLEKFLEFAILCG